MKKVDLTGFVRCAYSDLCIYAGAKKKKKKRRLGAVCSHMDIPKVFGYAVSETQEKLFHIHTLTNRLGI